MYQDLQICNKSCKILKSYNQDSLVSEWELIIQLFIHTYNLYTHVVVNSCKLFLYKANQWSALDLNFNSLHFFLCSISHFLTLSSTQVCTLHSFTLYIHGSYSNSSVWTLWSTILYLCVCNDLISLSYGSLIHGSWSSFNLFIWVLHICVLLWWLM